MSNMMKEHKNVDGMPSQYPALEKNTDFHPYFSPRYPLRAAKITFRIEKMSIRIEDE